MVSGAGGETGRIGANLLRQEPFAGRYIRGGGAVAGAGAVFEVNRRRLGIGGNQGREVGRGLADGRGGGAFDAGGIRSDERLVRSR